MNNIIKTTFFRHLALILLLLTIMPLSILGVNNGDKKNSISFLTGCNIVSDAYTKSADSLFTKEDAAIFMASLYKPYHYIQDDYINEPILYTDVSSFAKPYVLEATARDLLSPLTSTYFGAKDQMATTTFLKLTLERLGYSVPEQEVYAKALEIELLTPEEVSTIKKYPLTIGYASYILQSALQSIPNGMQNIVLAEVIAQEGITDLSYIERMSSTYQKLSQSMYYKFNKDKLPAKPTHPSYIAGKSKSYGAFNNHNDLIIDNNKVYYIESDYNKIYDIVKEKDLSTNTTRTIVDLNGFYDDGLQLLGIYNDTLYFAAYHKKVNDHNVFTGNYTHELFQLNLKTLKTASLYKKKTNAFTSTTSFHVTDKYIYCYEQNKNILIMNRTPNQKQSWKQIYTQPKGRQLLDKLTTDFNSTDNNLYGMFRLGPNVDSPAYIIQIEPTGKETKLLKVEDGISGITSHGDWIYISPYNSANAKRIHKKSFKVEQLPVIMLQLQYPWIYSWETRYLLDSPTEIIEPLYLPSTFGEHSIDSYYIYKDKAYLSTTIYEEGAISSSSFKPYSIDLTTWETKEVFYNREK